MEIICPSGHFRHTIFLLDGTLHRTALQKVRQRRDKAAWRRQTSYALVKHSRFATRLRERSLPGSLIKQTLIGLHLKRLQIGSSGRLMLFLYPHPAHVCYYAQSEGSLSRRWSTSLAQKQAGPGTGGGVDSYNAD